MEHALINDGKVLEIRELSDDETALLSPHYQQILPLDYFPRTPTVGWIFDNGYCYPDLKEVSAIQLRKALIISGIDLALIDAAFNYLPEPDASLARTAWEYASFFNRRDEFVKAVIPLLGMSDDMADGLWRLAESL